MFDKPQATHTLGLTIDGSSLKGAALSFVRKQPILDQVFDFIVDPITSSDNEHVKPLYTEEEKNALTDLAHSNLIVTPLTTQEVLVRPLELKIKKEKDIDDILPFQAEPLLPYPVENAVIDKIVVSKNKETHKLSIFAARKDHLATHIKQWNSLDIEPENITAEPAALALFTKIFFPNFEDAIYTLHIGLNHSLCILIDSGKLLAAQGINKGIDHLTHALAKDKDLSLADATSLLTQTSLLSDDTPELKKNVESLRLDVARTIYALGKQTKNQEINHILLTGEGALLPELKDLLNLSLNKTFLSPHPTPSFNIPAEKLQQFAIPIGAALSALPGTKEQINFRQQEFLYPSPWKRLKHPLAIYLSLCFGVAIALVLFGKAYLSYRESDLKRQYLELLNVMNKPYTAFEKEYLAKTIPSSESSEQVPSVNNLSQDDIKKRLSFLEKELQSLPQFYPLQPNVPSVSDVLAWLGTHPNVVGSGTNADTPSRSLQIENFSYTMLKRPELTKKQEKYQVKVELGFSAPTPKMAREFHDALVAPNDIVDAKGEIKWSSNRDTYRTSFYLKDRTVYPGT